MTDTQKDPIKNISQTIRVRASRLLSGKITPELSEAISAYAIEQDPDQKAQKKEAAKALIDNHMAAELKYLSVDLPIEPLMLTQKVGNLLYDIYLSHITEPKAPFAKAIWQKKNQDYAHKLDQETFEVPEEVRQVCYKAMADEDLWKKTVSWITFPTKEIDSEGKSVHRTAQVSCDGITQFESLLAMAMYAVGP